jgi:hypothetical protein
VHLNRVIRKLGLNVIYIAGPGHGGPGVVANTYLEGTYSELYPHIDSSEEGMRLLFNQFSWPSPRSPPSWIETGACCLRQSGSDRVLRPRERPGEQLSYGA